MTGVNTHHACVAIIITNLKERFRQDLALVRISTFRAMIRKYCLLLFCLLAAHASADPVRLVLTENGDFGEIFEAGLRPVRQAGMSNSMCVVRDVGIQLVTDGVVHPVIHAKTIRIRVLENHLLSSVEIISSEMLTKAQAVDLADSWGVDPEENTTFIDDGWLIGVNSKRWKAGAGFQRTYIPDKPYRFGIAIQWKRPMNEMSVHQGLLPPPPGFEHVSMEVNGQHSGGPATSGGEAMDHQANPGTGAAVGRSGRQPDGGNRLATGLILILCQ